MLKSATRCADPKVNVADGWIVRRLAPYCSRIELSMLPKQRDELKLLYSMGFETANIHWGSPSEVPNILKHLGRRHSHWLCHAAEKMADSVRADWKEWRRALQ